MSYRAYTFTYNNPTISIDECIEMFVNGYKTKYIVIGDEVAPTTGTPHYQGYVYFVSAKSIKDLTNKFQKVHFIIANGTAEQNRRYCLKIRPEDPKPNDIWAEWGEMPKQGKRNDLEDIRGCLADGGGMRDVVSRASSYQSVKMAETILKYNEKKRNWKPRVIWIWGSTGTGKTRKAMEMLDDPWISGKNLKWWEGYDAHKHVLVDDFRKDFCTFHELLRILDRYPYTVEVKGGSRQLLADTIIITSCFSPRTVYETREDVEQLIRRIDEVILMKNPETETETEVGW